MKLTKTFDKALIIVTVVILTLVFGTMITKTAHNTFAEGEDETFVQLEENFVTFYDEGKKLTVKTDAATVGEAVERAGIIINDSDIVEPGLDERINSNNFFINIYRARPAVVKDGEISKYIMTASFDPKTIAKEAGITVYDGDEIALVPNGNFLEAGVASTYAITRNGGRQLTEETEVPFTERTIKDYNLAPGQQEVRQLGEVGLKVTTYDVWYVDNVEQERKLVSEVITRQPVERIVAVGASAIERTPLTASKGRNRYTVTVNGRVIERQETFYDLPMSGVMSFCGGGGYSVRADGAKVDSEGYVLVAADLSRYPRCSVVETSLGPGKVYDTGSFVTTNPEQFDLATDWSNRDGR